MHVGVPLADSPAYGANSVERAVYEIAREMGGSISAKHGIGRLKRPFLGYSCSAAEIGVMRTMKGALGPLGISKPGKALWLSGCDRGDCRARLSGRSSCPLIPNPANPPARTVRRPRAAKPRST
ncbi:oxidoreductase [Burkholderia thailandensis]|uniref:FAD-linked oxidase C-terminal domain-containing protein n=1 Tax=Burkholderia thailandensis TaxID=57975 RepID=UPI001F302603|nr:FAD-linked oxidase C-terminal domain-containing protein [Burkholderia thailandensis]MCS6481764.1 oxidoreductase [Burkholderia thailandensis]MCZ2901088.1 oxidoreductase [Burkholderia thailandensis]